MKGRALCAALMLSLLTAAATSCVDAGPLHQTAKITKVSSQTICTELVFSNGSRGAHDCWPRSLLASDANAKIDQCVVLTERSVTAVVVGAKAMACPSKVDHASS
jgi:hypothetical protein